MKPYYHFLKRAYKENKYRQYLRGKLEQRKVILVHQMGKVASTSLVNSLEKLDSDMAICHTHYVKKESLDDFIQKYKAKKLPLDNYLIESQEISQFLDRTSQDYPWKIITIVREPIARNMSMFFENLDKGKQTNLYMPDFVEKYQSGVLEVDNLINNFLSQYPHEIPLNWLDKEIKDVFGVDVYSFDFSHDKGYQIIEFKNVEILILRLESLQNCLQDAFSEFLGIDNFRLSNKNQAKQKTYFEVYSDFLNSIVLPQSYIDKMYSSKYMKHFYSQNEIDKFREKWSKH